MGLFGFLKKKGETIELPPEEPEFLKKVDTTTESETAVKEEAEPELALWLSNGTAVTGLKELAAALKKMSAADYKEHVNPERNDIAEWVQEILHDNGLARKLRQARGKMQAAKAVEREINALNSAKKTAKPARIPTKAAATQLPRKGKQKLETEELKLPEIPELGEELQSIPLPEASFEEKPQLAAEKQGVFARLFKRKTKGEKQKLPETPPELPKLEDFELPKMEEPMELTEQLEPLKEKKGFLGFLFKRKESRSKEEKRKAETDEAATEIDAAIAAAAGAPATPEPAKSSPASEFEPEPHHAKWEEMQAQAELPEEAPAKEEEVKNRQPSGASRSKAKRRREHDEYEDMEFIRQDQEIETAERELNSQEEELNNKKLELTRGRYELIKQKGELEKKKFEEFIRKHKDRNEKEEALVREDLYSRESTAGISDFGIGGSGSEPGGRLKGMPDFRLSAAYGKERLEELLEEAKQHIRDNNVEEAQRALSEVQSVFDTVYMTNNEKKQIEYEMLEVEADLKLASLK
ncbi:hypothetical protein HYU20_02500 [Candidatus Woesearchaeota archaeon]|nr:hypothetical protein [Candidatus Woesearchaeota archaeon]